MNKLQRAYLAGLIDGEGYIGIMKSQRGNKAKWYSNREFIFIPTLKIAMTSKELIGWLRGSCGGTVETRKAHGNAKESYCWTCRKAAVSEIMKLVHPYLRVKKPQAEIILRFPRGIAGHPIEDSVYQKRIKLCDEIRALNHRGSVRD